MKFIHKDGRIVETHNAYEESIIRNNPNFKEYKEQVKEEKPQKITKKGGSKPSI